MRVLGATAVPLPTNEVVPALQRGAIDGTQSAIAVFVNFKYIDLGKVLTQTDDTMLVPVAVVSKAWLEKLPAGTAEAGCRRRAQAAGPRTGSGRSRSRRNAQEMDQRWRRDRHPARCRSGQG